MTGTTAVPGRKKPRVIINGRFLSQRLSGVQRYANEVVLALDALIAGSPTTFGLFEWVMAAPVGVRKLTLKAIRTIEVGTRQGHLWEQTDLRRFCGQDRLISLANSAPILRSNQVVVLHDAAVFAFPETFGLKYRNFHRFMSKAVSRTSRIGTVSLFSRAELAKYLDLVPEDIFVTYNGADHVNRTEADDRVLERVGVARGNYLLFVGSPSPRKNISVILRAIDTLGRDDIKLVVAGSSDRKIFKSYDLTGSGRIIVAPDLLDSEIKSLYQHATALVFPSLYEGFGIPAMEAMSVGCPIICSDIPVLREICGPIARYIPPDDIDIWSKAIEGAVDDKVDTDNIQRGLTRSRDFTWARAAAVLSRVAVEGLEHLVLKGEDLEEVVLSKQFNEQEVDQTYLLF